MVPADLGEGTPRFCERYFTAFVLTRGLSWAFVSSFHSLHVLDWEKMSRPRGLTTAQNGEEDTRCSLLVLHISRTYVFSRDIYNMMGHEFAHQTKNYILVLVTAS